MLSDKKEKVLIYTAIVIVAIIFIIVMYFIWSPFINETQNNDLNDYDTSITYENSMCDYYRNYLSEALKVTSFDNLYGNLDDDYINTISDGNKENVKQYLLDNNLISMDINITNIEYSTDSINNVFRVTYTTHNMTKYVNITENRPYNFKINFEQDNLKSLINSSGETTYDNLKYNFEILESTLNSIRYKVTITNNSEYNYEFDFSALNSLQIIDNNSHYTNMALVANSVDVDYTLTPGSSKSIEVLFNISFENQMNITGFKFNNVILNGTTTSIEVNI